MHIHTMHAITRMHNHTYAHPHKCARIYTSQVCIGCMRIVALKKCPNSKWLQTVSSYQQESG